MAETLKPGVEIKPARLLRSPLKLASKTGGTLSFEEGKLLGINYKSGNILWADHPKRRPGVCEATPFLRVKFPREYGTSLNVDAVVLKENIVVFVSPSFRDDSLVSGYTFTNGDFSSFEIPTALVSENLIVARDMARAESERYTRIARRRAAVMLKRGQISS